MINASARFELLTANQQLIDFHLNRVMKTMFKKKDQDILAGNNSDNTDPTNNKLTNLLQMEKSVIVEVSEHEENNTT